MPIDWTVIVAIRRIAACAKIDPHYSSGGANVHSHLTHVFLSPLESAPLNGISIDSSVLAGPTVMTDAETNRNSDRLLSVKTCVEIGWIYITLAMRTKSTGNCNELSRQLHTWQLNKTASPTAEVSRCRRCLRPLPIIVTTRRWLLLTGIICDFMLMFCSDLRSREPLSSLVE